MEHRFLREHRKRAKLTQQQVAKAVSLSRAHYSRLESNVPEQSRGLTIDRLAVLARLFGCETADLLKHPDEMIARREQAAKGGRRDIDKSIVIIDRNIPILESLFQDMECKAVLVLERDEAFRLLKRVV